MLPKLQEMVLREVQRHGPDARASGVQEALSKLVGREQSFGSIFTTLDRLVAKGMLDQRKGQPDDRRGGRAPRLYTLRAEGVTALKEATRINYELHRAAGEGEADGQLAGSVGGVNV